MEPYQEKDPMQQVIYNVEHLQVKEACINIVSIINICDSIGAGKTL